MLLYSKTLLLFGVLALFAGNLPLTAADRPNILWIVSEDNSQLLGCYGDANARTPHLDALAGRGIRYTNSFANAPVCAVARSSWILGVPAVSTGTSHMRSKYRIPRDIFKTYPELLKEAGYFVTNRSKTDYNTDSIDVKAVWDMCSRNAHYSKRADGQPFFAVFNLGESHESGIFREKHTKEPRVAAENITVPPYQLPVPAVINDWRYYYDRLELMDARVGEALRELEESGEAENTIVVYCSDHGGITLRSKRFLHDTGTRIPLIVYFPEKWQHLAPEKPGTVSDRLVQFIDMPKTWLSLCGVTPPDVMTGRIFLGREIQPAPETVFLFSGRFDESPDTSRGITDGRWKYIRNYESDRPRFQTLTYPLRHFGQIAQYEAYLAGKTNAQQSAQYQPQPPEELYDTLKDPHEVNNLASSNPEMLTTMRKRLQQHILQSRDLGFIPETLKESIDATSEQTIFEFGQSSKNYPLKDVLIIATLASDGDAANIRHFKQALQSDNETIRYWGAVGLRILGKDAAPARKAIEEAIKDKSPSVRTQAMITLGKLGEMNRATQLLLEEAEKATGDIHAMWAIDGLCLLDAPEALEGHDVEAINKGNYSNRRTKLLKAGGSAWRMPSREMLLDY